MRRPATAALLIWAGRLVLTVIAVVAAAHRVIWECRPHAHFHWIESRDRNWQIDTWVYGFPLPWYERERCWNPVVGQDWRTWEVANPLVPLTAGLLAWFLPPRVVGLIRRAVPSSARRRQMIAVGAAVGGLAAAGVEAVGTRRFRAEMLPPNPVPGLHRYTGEAMDRLFDLRVGRGMLPSTNAVYVLVTAAGMLAGAGFTRCLVGRAEPLRPLPPTPPLQPDLRSEGPFMPPTDAL